MLLVSAVALLHLGVELGADGGIFLVRDALQVVAVLLRVAHELLLALAHLILDFHLLVQSTIAELMPLLRWMLFIHFIAGP